MKYVPVVVDSDMEVLEMLLKIRHFCGSLFFITPAWLIDRAPLTMVEFLLFLMLHLFLLLPSFFFCAFIFFGLFSSKKNFYTSMKNITKENLCTLRLEFLHNNFSLLWSYLMSPFLSILKFFHRTTF